MALLAYATLAQPFQTGSPYIAELYVEFPKNPYFQAGENVTINIHVYNSTGYIQTSPATSCELHLYNSTGDHVVDTTMLYDSSEKDFYYELDRAYTSVPVVYSMLVACNNTKEAGFISTTMNIAYGALPEQGGDTLPMVFIAVLPMLFGFFLLIGSISLGEEHTVLKIALFLLSLITFYMSINMGLQTVIKYYGFSELQEYATFIMWMIGLMLFAIFSYYMIYILTTAIHIAAQKKQERLRY